MIYFIYIYLKLLYESPDQIIEQCINWGFNEELINILIILNLKI